MLPDAPAAWVASGQFAKAPVKRFRSVTDSHEKVKIVPTDSKL